MKLRTSLALFAAMALGAAGSSLPASAQNYHDHGMPGRHPGYLHAIQDLRIARQLLSHWTPSEHLDDVQAHAISKIDHAIDQLKIAAYEDGKNPNWNPPADVMLEPANRFRQAHEALDRAGRDLHEEEDNHEAHDARNHAENDIHDARMDVEKITHHFHWGW